VAVPDGPYSGFEEVFTDDHYYTLVCCRCGYRLDFMADYGDPKIIRIETIGHLMHHRRWMGPRERP